MRSSEKSRSSLRQITLLLAGLVACPVVRPTNAAAPVVGGIDSAAYAAEVRRLQKAIEELVRDAEAKEEKANTDYDLSSANEAAALYAKAAGRSAQQYFMSRSTGRSVANEEILVRRYVRQSYALKPDRGSFLNPELALAREQAIAWLRERGVEVDLAADSALLEHTIELLPEAVFIHCAPVVETPCPIPPQQPPPQREAAPPCPNPPESKPEPQSKPKWQRLGLDFSQVVGASIHRGREGFTFTHRVVGGRLGLFGRVWEGPKGTIGLGVSYGFRSHRIGVPPIVGDKADLPSLLIYEHSIATGPRFRVSLPTPHISLYFSASLGLSTFNPLIRSDGSQGFSDPYYKKPRLYGEGMLGLLFAKDIILLNFFISGTHFDRVAREHLGTPTSHGLALGGGFGVDLLRLIQIGRKTLAKP